MSESLEKPQQATSVWRRTSLAAITALFAFILARFAVRSRPALPTGTRQIEAPEDALDRQIRLCMPATMASAPAGFTPRVLARIATMPAPQQLTPVRPARVSWLRSLRIVAGTVTVALLLMLMTGFLVTLIDPSLAVAILNALMSLAIGLLAFGRALAQLIGNAAATPWMIPVAMGGLLGFLLLSWVQLARQFERDPREA